MDVAAFINTLKKILGIDLNRECFIDTLNVVRN